MTLAELQQALARCPDITTCSAFLMGNLHEIRPLFYGKTSDELHSTKFEYENAFLALASSSLGQQIATDPDQPPQVTALLILFLSLFERARLHDDVLSVANLLPAGSLRLRAQAIFEYRSIYDAEKEYPSRFEGILTLLEQASDHVSPEQRANCEDLLIEYYAEAILESLNAGVNVRKEMQIRFCDPSASAKFHLLRSPRICRILTLQTEPLRRERAATRSRIVEAFHCEACALVPEVLLLQAADEHLGDERPDTQQYKDLPPFLDDRLAELGAVNNPQHQIVRVGLNADHVRNLAYLGTYFPRSVIESQNIVTEILSIPMVAAAFAQKDVIRILDIGSGTGGSTAGAVLAVAHAISSKIPIEVTSLDGNEDALHKQMAVLETLAEHIQCPLLPTVTHLSFPTDLDGFVKGFSSFALAEGPRFDLILFWKHLSEYYNTSFVHANGIVRQALQIASTMLVPNGLCFVLDLTTTDNGVEHFSMTLNREANAYDSTPGATMTTVLPLPCARHARTCRHNSCYMQRIFVANHRLCKREISKVAYRVFAPNQFAATILGTFTQQPDYRVNAHRGYEACRGGAISMAREASPSGFTGFFEGRRGS